MSPRRKLKRALLACNLIAFSVAATKVWAQEQPTLRITSPASYAVRNAPPYTFPVVIPRDITPGPYGLMADGVTVSRRRIYSERLYIDVERADQPVSIRTEPEGPIDSYPQEQFALNVIGKYHDGSSEDLSSSTRTKYISSNPHVVTVDANGFVKSIALGNAQITVRVGAKVINVPFSVKPR